VSFCDPSSLLLRAIRRSFAGSSIQRACHIIVISLVAATSLAAEAQTTEKLTSPDGKYSVQVVRNNEDSLVLLQGGETIGKVATSIGPVDSLFEALWSPDGKYVAINKQRSSRPGGDEMWIFALPAAKVMRKPDDGLWNELEKKAWAFIDEKHLTETGGKAFLTLSATAWEKGGLRFRLEEGFSEVEDRYFFGGILNPADVRAINSWKISKAKL
jgi:hypothetical protein